MLPGLSEFLMQRSKAGLSAQLSSLILAQCFRAKLWEDSPYVSKQLEKIGGCMSVSLLSTPVTSWAHWGHMVNIHKYPVCSFRSHSVHCHGERWINHLQQNREHPPQGAGAGQSSRPRTHSLCFAPQSKPNLTIFKGEGFGFYTLVSLTDELLNNGCIFKELTFGWKAAFLSKNDVPKRQ